MDMNDALKALILELVPEDGSTIGNQSLLAAIQKQIRTPPRRAIGRPATRCWRTESWAKDAGAAARSI